MNLDAQDRLSARRHRSAMADGKTCIACHTGIASPRGEDVGFVSSWRASMMANAARDPYWQGREKRI